MGIPWSEKGFAEQMVKCGHPAETGLPQVLKDAVDRYGTMDAQQRVSLRASKVRFWLKRMVDFKFEEKKLKETLNPDVAAVLHQKNMLLWQAMLKSVGYPDMAVVDEFQRGTELIGCAETTGLWPVKFQPATITVSELRHIAEMERDAIGGQFQSDGPGEFSEQCGRKPWRSLQRPS